MFPRDMSRSLSLNCEELVLRIITTNRVWHDFQELLDPDDPIVKAQRDTKNRLQRKLLTEFPDRVSPVFDRAESETAGEDIYSLKLREPIQLPGDDRPYDHAAHVPHRLLLAWGWDPANGSAP
ncbi:MAG: hypothetical protein VKK80_07335 [Prochlorothrix sp.]|nr:hypothetical protein [Prochlorothrix sp.]